MHHRTTHNTTGGKTRRGSTTRQTEGAFHLDLHGARGGQRRRLAWLGASLRLELLGRQA
jgi:hypothetical protein